MDEQTARYYHQKRIGPTRTLLKHLQREADAKEKLRKKTRNLANCHQALRKCRADLNLSNVRADDLARWIDEGRRHRPKSAEKTGKGRRKSRGGRRRINRRKTKRRKKRRRKRTRKGGRRRSRRRTKVRRPYLMVKIERNPLSYKKIQKGGFLGALAKTAMGAVAGGGGGDPLGGLMKAGMGALGGGGGGGLMDFAKKMGKDVLGRAKGGLMDKIGGFVNGAGGGAGGGGGGGGGGGEELLSGTPSVELEECDPSERPEFPKGPDGCGKHESPKPTVKQLKQGYVDDNQVYQLENY